MTANSTATPPVSSLPNSATSTAPQGPESSSPVAPVLDSDSVPSTPPPVYHGGSRESEKALELVPEAKRLPSYTSSTSTFDEKADIEKQGPIWEGFQDDELPDKTQGKWLRNVRFQMFSLYRRLFGIVFFTNLGIFIWYCVKGANANQVATVVIGNLFASILMRQEYVINAFFTVACLAPKRYVPAGMDPFVVPHAHGLSWPLWIRRILARVYSIGGSELSCVLSRSSTDRRLD